MFLSDWRPRDSSKSQRCCGHPRSYPRRPKLESDHIRLESRLHGLSRFFTLLRTEKETSFGITCQLLHKKDERVERADEQHADPEAATLLPPPREASIISDTGYGSIGGEGGNGPSNLSHEQKKRIEDIGRAAGK